MLQPLRLLSALNEFLGRAASLLLVVALVAIVWEVFARYLLGKPTIWAHELTVFLCAIAFLVGGPYVTKRDSHIAITSVYALLPPRVRLGMDIFHALFAITFLALFTWAAWKSGSVALERWERTGSAWNPPTPALLKPAIAIAGGLMCLQVAANLVLRLAGAGERQAPPPPGAA